MKHIRTYESLDTTGVANVIGDIVERFDSKLRIDHVEVHPFEPTLVMKIYEEFNSDTYKDFREFLDILDKLELTWLFEATEDGVNFSINFSSFNRHEMDILVQTNKYNL